MNLEDMTRQADTLFQDAENERILIDFNEQECLEELGIFSQTTSVDSSDSSISTETQKEFYIGYPGAETSMQKVSAEDLGSYFDEHGGVKIDGTTYEITIDGNSYRYDIKTESLSIMENGKWESYIGCRFYKTSETNLGEINNTITFLPGSGETSYGAVKIKNEDKNHNGINNDADINNGSLLIVPFLAKKRPKQENMHWYHNEILATTYLGNFLANGSTNSSNHVKNKLLGYSFGVPAAFKLAATAPENYFDTLVAVDMGEMIRYGQKEKDLHWEKTIDDNDYQKIKNMEFIFMSTPDTSDHANSIKETIKKLMSCEADNITFYTNWEKYQDSSKQGYGIDGFDPIMVTEWDEEYKTKCFNEELPLFQPWTRSSRKNDPHNQGYKLIEYTNILSYLSS